MPVRLPAAALATPSARAFACGTIGCVALFVAAYLSANAWVNELALFALVGLLLQSGLRQRSACAWLAWIACAVVLVALGSRGNGRLALDLLPAVLNLAFCTVFARSLGPEAMPLIARIIEAIEGRGRLALPRVADYARALTWAWALLLGMQAALLAWLALRDFGAVAFPALSGSQWRWYLHFGSYALVPAFLVLEYAFRRWWLRHIPHASLAHFLVQLTRNWPALIRSVALDASRTGR
jgi:hypothetical protein